MISLPQTQSTAIGSKFSELVLPVLPAYLVSRGIILILAVFLQWLLDTGRAFKYGFIGNAPFSTLSALFDANWYGSIATNGYQASFALGEQSNIHFMPFYPLLMRIAGTVLGLGGVSGGYNLAGVALSHVFFLAALIVLYKFTTEVWQDGILATRSVWIMALSPWSFVFSMTYTESLFLLLSLSAIALAFHNRNNLTLAQLASIALLTTLATLTRPQGIVVAVPVLFLLAVTPRQLSPALRLGRSLAAIVPPVAALIAFMIFIGVITGNPGAVLKANSAWGNGWWSDMGRLLVLPPANPVWFVDVLSAVGLVVWVIILARIARHVITHGPYSLSAAGEQKLALAAFAIYSFSYFLFTALTSASNSSWGRYMMVIFPCIWVAASWFKTERSYKLFLKISLLLQCTYFSAAVLLQVTA